jgi:hypothetical protein
MYRSRLLDSGKWQVVALVCGAAGRKCSVSLCHFAAVCDSEPGSRALPSAVLFCCAHCALFCSAALIVRCFALLRLMCLLLLSCAHCARLCPAVLIVCILLCCAHCALSCSAACLPQCWADAASDRPTAAQLMEALAGLIAARQSSRK